MVEKLLQSSSTRRHPKALGADFENHADVERGAIARMPTGDRAGNQRV